MFNGQKMFKTLVGQSSFLALCAKAQNQLIQDYVASYKYQGSTRAAPNYSEFAEPRKRSVSDERHRRQNFSQKSEARARMHRPNARLAPLWACSPHGVWSEVFSPISAFFEPWFIGFASPLSILTPRQINDSRNPPHRVHGRTQ